MFADLPPQLQERAICSISAAVKYQVPANIVLAIAEKEGGKPGQWVKNKNGTHDVGPLQFNTAYLSNLTRYGITANDVAAAGCYPYDLAAWRIRLHIRDDQGDLWTKVANYHSRTPHYNAAYRADLMRRANKWADWLDARLITYNVNFTATSIGAPDQARAFPAANIAQKPRPARSARPIASPYVPRQLIASTRTPETP